jgi:myosin heavy subunit
MSASKREGLAAKLIAESKEINEGLKKLDLAQESDENVDMTGATKEAFLMREIEKRDERIKELNEAQNDLLEQIQEFEQENIKYANEAKELKDTISELKAQLSALKDENTELTQAREGIEKARELAIPDLDVSDLIKELKVPARVYSRGLVTHAVAERTYDQMRDIMFYLERVAPVKRIREGEFWNIAVWFMHAVFNDLKDEPSLVEMAEMLKESSDSAEVLLQFCAMLLAHLNIDDSWS